MKRKTIIAISIMIISIGLLSGCTSHNVTNVGESIHLSVKNNYYTTVTLNILINGISVYYETLQYGVSYSGYIEQKYYGESITVKAIVDTVIINTKTINDNRVTVSISSSGYPNIY